MASIGCARVAIITNHRLFSACVVDANQRVARICPSAGSASASNAISSNNSVDALTSRTTRIHSARVMVITTLVGVHAT